MAKITRNDGTSFIIPDYREALSDKKISVLKNEVTLLSQTYGEFIYIQKNLDDSFDVAFSTEPGYLLAESIVKYIKTSNNFIYIERLQNSDTVIFITLKQGKIYIDTQISVDTLADEFVIIQAEQMPFDIYLYGDLPVSNQEQDTDKVFVGNIAKSFTVMQESVFDHLPHYSECELKTINDAFTEAGIIQPTNIKIITTIVILIIIVLVWFFWPKSTTQHIQLPQIIETKSQYYDYVQTLETPGPTQQLEGLITFTEVLQDLPAGWQPQSINVTSSDISITLRNISNAGSLEMLHAWAAAKGISMNISSTIISLNFKTAYPVRAAQRNIYSTQEIARVIIDRLKPVLNNTAINVATIMPEENYQRQPISFNVRNISLNTLDIVAKQFADLPVLFDSAELIQGGNGLLTGSIHITIVGN